MYKGESYCEQCNEPISAKWYNENNSYDVGGHFLKEAAFLVDGTMKIKYMCKECKTENQVTLDYVR
ncbi:Hypothetical protein DPCES_1400 [Desulfitobacterium hafniense]|uniref:Uncharacterized protein n=1 Tax=Desulfitobacterium hafniense TaxID=49338 RepID=A0A098AYV6_DESHA|nr:hypothetical protein [Desulfitobacterium hafniense]CDX01287.1 Hypothetical protein DPCES_1400 [Desulfitobacterium hafniense]